MATNKLTIPAVKNAKPSEKQWKLSDGGGLYLLIQPKGGKYWRLKYRYQGKEKVLALGVYPETTLALAREGRDRARVLLGNGTDPSLVRKQRKRAGRINSENTFEALALDWIEQQRGRWSIGHTERVIQSLESDVFPHIGYRAISELTPPDILEVVRKVESRDALDVAGRILQRCGAIFRYAVQTGRAQTNPASELKGVLKTRKVEHRAAITRAELPQLLRDVATYEGYLITRLALKLLILTFVRPGELRFARWDEFDLEARVWRIPGERMKMKTEHLVPLSRQAIDLLEQLKPITGHYDLLFSGERGQLKPISENTMTYALYRMGYKSRATAHGFRTTASSILNEEGFNPDAIERQLSHLERNQVRGAYTKHAEYLKDRTRMMQWWADYLDQLETGSNVVPGKFGASN
ncbi:MAG: integrase arm-type DNA-binding domain-containing protein [Porticoccaceae bacterium]